MAVDLNQLRACIAVLDRLRDELAIMQQAARNITREVNRDGPTALFEAANAAECSILDATSHVGAAHACYTKLVKLLDTGDSYALNATVTIKEKK